MAAFSWRLTLFVYRQRAFFIPFTLLWILISILQTFSSQREIILAVNRHNTPFADWFFWLITAVGNGVFILGVAVLIFFFSKKQAAIIVAGYLLSGLIIQISKKFIFIDMHRPYKALSDISNELHKVDGVVFFSNNSFPSGHTASAFAMFATLAFMTRYAFLKNLCLLVACLVGYSRLYLLQHFLRDVFVGALIGVLTALFCQLIFDKYRVLNKLQ